MKITFLLQTFNKVEHLESIYDNLTTQISKCDSQELYQHSNNGIIISDSKNKDEICITYSNENNNEIVLIYNDYHFTLNNNNYNTINLYSIINTCINC